MTLNILLDNVLVAKDNSKDSFVTLQNSGQGSGQGYSQKCFVPASAAGQVKRIKLLI